VNYYNEWDKKTAAWLRQLIAERHIPDGEVDERSITEVEPNDLRGYRQCHFFAGIAGWPIALQLAGWSADRPVWTGSCPCPPFSQAGEKSSCPMCSSRVVMPHPWRQGYFACAECYHEWYADGRHLWPEFYRLIKECQPATVFGEQVASASGRAWLAGVCASLEELGYAMGAADLCAASAGAPHIRQRLWWVADAERGTAKRHGYEMGSAASSLQGESREQRIRHDAGHGGIDGTQRLQHSTGDGREQWRAESGGRRAACGCGAGCGVGDGISAGLEGHAGDGDDWHEPRRHDAQQDRPATASGFWDDREYIPCGDGKTRPTEPGSPPLAHGIPARVVQLRGYGNAIVPQVAAEFISAYMEAIV